MTTDRFSVDKTFTHCGYTCVIATIKDDYHCGYIAIPDEHNMAGKDYTEIDVTVHGGLTFGPQNDLHGMGEDDDTVWYGFDCAHAGDHTRSMPGGTNWQSEDVREELLNLAEQFRDLDTSETKSIYSLMQGFLPWN
jgi:hypothetical protein